MPVPSAITDLSQTAGSNYPSGGESPITADNYFQAYASFIALLRDGKGFTTQTTLASGTTTDIGGQNSPFVSVTGTTTITGFGTNYNGPRFVSFTGALILTHSATLVIPGAANITTAAGDSAIAIPISGGWQIVAYQKASGLPVSTTGLAPIASPTFTGVPAAPTAAAATSTTQLATTAFVQQEVPAASTTAAGKVELLTSAEAQAGTDTTRAMTATAMKAAQIQPQTAVTLTTQTAVDFTSIPSWVNRVTLLFSSSSTNGTSVPIVQLGDAGGFETSGYTGNVSVGSNGVAWTVGATPASGFGLSTSNAAGSVYTGKLVLDRINGNEWVASGDWAQTTATISTHLLTGAKTLSATLTQIRLTTVGGSDQFDAGTVNVSYE